MKIITIQKAHTAGKSGYVASLNGFEGGTAFGTTEVATLKKLTALIEEKNPDWIQKSDFEWNK